MKKQRKLERIRTVARSAPADREVYAHEVWRRPEIRGLATRIQGLRRDTSRHLVDVGLEVGELLQRAHARARPKLEGLFQQWVKDVLHIDPKTASNQMALAEVSSVEPNFIEDWKDLGLAKLYHLARLTPKARQQVLRAPHLEEMTDLEFARLLKPHKPARQRKVTPRMHAHGMRMKLQAWRAKASAFVVPPLEPAAREQLRRDYQDLVEVLQRHIKKLGR